MSATRRQSAVRRHTVGVRFLRWANGLDDTFGRFVKRRFPRVAARSQSAAEQARWHRLMARGYAVISVLLWLMAVTVRSDYVVPLAGSATALTLFWAVQAWAWGRRARDGHASGTLDR